MEFITAVKEVICSKIQVEYFRIHQFAKVVASSKVQEYSFVIFYDVLKYTNRFIKLPTISMQDIKHNMPSV